MPVMDGFTACAELRELPGGDRVPVVMMTGLDDVQSIERAFEVGATDFITKPINWADPRAPRALHAARQHRDQRAQAEPAPAVQRAAHRRDGRLGVGRARRTASCRRSRPGASSATTRDAPALPVDGFFATVHPDDAERVRQACEQAIATASAFAIDHRIVPPTARCATCTSRSRSSSATQRPARCAWPARCTTSRGARTPRSRSGAWPTTTR